MKKIIVIVAILVFVIYLYQININDRKYNFEDNVRDRGLYSLVEGVEVVPKKTILNEDLVFEIKNSTDYVLKYDYSYDGTDFNIYKLSSNGKHELIAEIRKNNCSYVWRPGDAVFTPFISNVFASAPPPVYTEIGPRSTTIHEYDSNQSFCFKLSNFLPGIFWERKLDKGKYIAVFRFNSGDPNYGSRKYVVSEEFKIIE